MPSNLFKLHIGCGNTYLEGYINIDAFDKSVADNNYPAWKLPYNCETVSEINADQLIEHLGFAGVKFSFAEWYRVLKPGGKLIITTPDIKGSSQILLDAKGPREIDILNWIYGLDYEGYRHKLCFPQALLIKELEEAGFDKIEAANYEYSPQRPALKVACQKPYKTNRIKLMIAEIRSKMTAEKNIIDLENVHPAKAVLESIFQELEHLEKKKALSLIIKATLLHPDIARVLPDILLKYNFLTPSSCRKISKIIKKLTKQDFTLQLFNYFKQLLKNVRFQNEAYSMAVNLGEEYLKYLFSTSPLKVAPFYSKKEPLLKGKAEWFDLIHLEILSNVYLAKGIKLFLLGRLKPAEEDLSNAVNFNVNNYQAWWNLARLYLARRKILKAIKYYVRALEAVPESKRKILTEELDDILRKGKANFCKEAVSYDERI